MNKIFRVITIVALLVALQGIRFAHTKQGDTEKYNIYYLTIGSGYYPLGGDTKQRPEAVNSAKTMAFILRKLGGKGYELLSEEGTPVTNVEMLNKIDELSNDIIREKPKNPLIVLYFMGHGLGDRDFKQYIAFGDYNFRMKKVGHDAGNGGAAYEIEEIAEYFNKINIEDSAGRSVMNKGQINLINTIREKGKFLTAKDEDIKQPEDERKILEDLQKFDDSLEKTVADYCTTYKKQGGIGECKIVNAGGGIAHQIELAKKLQGVDFNNLSEEEQRNLWSSLGGKNNTPLKMFEFSKKMQGKSFNDLSDEEKREFIDLQDEMNSVSHSDEEKKKIQALYEKSPDEITEDDQKQAMALIEENANGHEKTTGLHFNHFTPYQKMLMEQAKQRSNNGSHKSEKQNQEKLEQAGISHINEIASMVTPTKLYPHIPYLVIIDACSNGLMGQRENYMKKAAEAKAEIEKFKKKNPELAEMFNSNKEDYKQYTAKYPYLDERFLQASFGLYGAGVFKDQGAFFFAASPGEESQAFEASNDRFAKGFNKMGRLAKRFELAVNQATDLGKDISLGEFVGFFSADREEKLPQPFTWFKLPQKLSDTVLIEGR